MAAFRRLDAHKWAKWQFYPGAMTILVPRLIFGAIFGICVVSMVSICLIGHDRSKPIQIGFRKWFLRQVYIFWSTMLSMFTFSTCIKHKYISDEKVNYYEEYLGTREEQAAEQTKPDIDEENKAQRRVPKRGPGKCSTVICNHVGF